jgi:phosphoribosylformylglycinamidine synthase subunit PurL
MLLGGLGSTDAIRFGGTEYAKVVLNKMWGLPPLLDMDTEKHVQAAIREIVTAGLAESSHDLGDGGLAAALAECSGGGIGADIELETGLRPQFALFHEGPSRVLLSTAEPEAVVRIARRYDVDCPRIGVTMKERLRIGHPAQSWVDSPVDRLRDVSENALENLLSPVHV